MKFFLLTPVTAEFLLRVEPDAENRVSIVGKKFCFNNVSIPKAPSGLYICFEQGLEGELSVKNGSDDAFDIVDESDRHSVAYPGQYFSLQSSGRINLSPDLAILVSSRQEKVDQIQEASLKRSVETAEHETQKVNYEGMKVPDAMQHGLCLYLRRKAGETECLDNASSKLFTLPPGADVPTLELAMGSLIDFATLHGHFHCDWMCLTLTYQLIIRFTESTDKDVALCPDTLHIIYSACSVLATDILNDIRLKRRDSAEQFYGVEVKTLNIAMSSVLALLEENINSYRSISEHGIMECRENTCN